MLDDNQTCGGAYPVTGHVAAMVLYTGQDDILRSAFLASEKQRDFPRCGHLSRETEELFLEKAN